jgi:hypothetical protein
MAKVHYIDPAQVELAKVQSNLNDFLTLKSRLETRYNALSGAQKLALLDTITNWGTATAAQKSDALLGACALTIITVGYVLRILKPKLFEENN